MLKGKKFDAFTLFSLQKFRSEPLNVHSKPLNGHSKPLNGHSEPLNGHSKPLNRDLSAKE